MICISDHFFYDGIDCRFLQIGLFREDKKFSGDIAFSQTVNYEDASGGTPYFKDVSRSASSFEFLVAKYDRVNMQIKPLTVKDRIDIMDYLIKDSPREFIDLGAGEDLKFYATFKDASIELSPTQKGFIKVSMELYSPYSYLNAVYSANLTSASTKTIEVWNKSNCVNKIAPIIEVDFIDSGEWGCFKIENLNTHQEITVYGEPGKYILYCENCFVDGEYSEINGEFISLKKGVNNLRLSGEANFVIKVCSPMAY